MYNVKNWPYKWFGIWKEYGDNYKNYPSIYNCVEINSYTNIDKEGLFKYLTESFLIASTSSISFPSPFNGEIIGESVSYRTDGEWIWLDNIAHFIKNNNLLIPEIWYETIKNNNFFIDKALSLSDEYIDKLDWPSL